MDNDLEIYDGYKILGRCRGCGKIYTFKGHEDGDILIDIYGTPIERDLATGCIECKHCGGFWAFNLMKVEDWVNDLFWKVKGN